MGEIMENQINITDNIKEGVYIPNIEALWLYKAYVENKDKNYEVNMNYLDKLLNGKLDYSYELVKNKELLDTITILEDKYGNQYTFDIINVKYKKKYKSTDKTKEKTTKQLKDWTYIDGFKFNNNKMVNWKRSSGKARVNENLFINSKIEGDKWARMGLEFKGDVDIAAIRAYESLPLSSIIGTVEINPKNIFVIKDFKSKFPWTMSKTWLEGEELKTKTMEVEECNSIWDGEGLLSKKIFDENELIQGKGVALLRNRYMKCAGFCTDLEAFFREYCKEHEYDYETYEREDDYGNRIKVKDIELITTPSSIKIEKFNNEVIEKLKKDGCTDEDINDNIWLKYWKDNCGTTFGICKTEKPSHYEDGKYNVLSYQMLNDIPFTKDELKSLVVPEIKYIEKLKNELDFFLQEANQVGQIDFEDDNSIEDDEEAEVERGVNLDVTGAFLQLSKRNPEFIKTQVFKDFRRNFINAYISKLRKGKIRIESDYCVACGNGYEMLLATVGEFDGVTSLLKDDELYCSRFGDGENIVGFRNPSVNVGNIGIQKNKYIEELETYFNCTPNIVHLNSIKYPILSTYQGEDFDIDCNLLTNDPIIVKACSRIVKESNETDCIITPIPLNGIEATGSNKKELTGQNMSDIDFIIAQNFIGSVINLSQEISSLYNHKVYNKLATTEELNNMYQMTSTLSSISQCEIDKAKKQFEKLNVPSELAKRKVDFKLVDNDKINELKEEINKLKVKLNKLKERVKKYRKDKRKPVLKEIRDINKILENDSIPKLSDDKVTEYKEEIVVLKDKIKETNEPIRDIKKLLKDETLSEEKITECNEEIIKLESEIKEILKPLNSRLRKINKALELNSISKLSDAEIIEYKNKIIELEKKITITNMLKQDKIDKVNDKISAKYIELSQLDNRRIKPYFFKFIGDTDAKKQRKVTNKKHKKELDNPIIEQFCKDNNIDIKDVKMKDKELQKLLKVNDNIQKEWEDKIYDRTMDTPMNWLQSNLDTIKNGKKIGTVHIIQLIKKNKHKADQKVVNYIVNNIKKLDTEIDAHRLNKNLTAKIRLDKIRDSKKQVIKNIKFMKLNKTNMYWILKECLNTCKKNGKIDKKSGIESLALEILFQTYGSGLLEMFA